MTVNLTPPRSRANQHAAWIFSLMLAAIPLAAPEGAELGPHTHGVSQLDVALSGQDLDVGLTVPGADAVGFEHPPHGDQEKSAVKAAIKKLEQAGTLFVFPAAAACRLVKAEVHSEGLEEEHGGAHHDEADHNEHDHAKENSAEQDHHDHAVHDEGKKGAHGEEEHGAGHHHAEFEGRYRFHCERPNGLNAVELGIFKAFPSVTRINARILGRRGQSAKALNPGSPRLEF